MKKEELKSDFTVLDKLDDELFKCEIAIAYKTFVDLNINSEIEFCIYQIYLEELKKVTYKEIKSYIRLLNAEYLSSIVKLRNELGNENKILTFPSFPN